ncbi:MAG: DUF6226 family protein [Arthrobacter sp.]|jgi:hypothetical protein|nr:DUF6226 family protein [Arthrobacter sp.]
MDLTALRADVDRRFALRPNPVHGWEDPHPSAPAREEEYALNTEPQRYAIAAQRAQAWVEALEEAGLAQLRASRTPAWAADMFEGKGRAALLAPTRLGALPLTVVLLDWAGGEANAVALGVGGGEPAEALLLPDCGCDGCDPGSERLLEELDDVIADVVGGTFAHANGGAGESAWVVQSTLDGAWGRNLFTRTVGDMEGVLARVRAGENVGERSLHGRAWG